MRDNRFRLRHPRTGAFPIIAAISLAVTVLLGTQAPASAETACLPHAEVAKRLGDRYAETPVGIELASNGGLIELFSSPDGSTWTMVMTTPTGVSCVMAAGEAWQNFPMLVSGPEA